MARLIRLIVIEDHPAVSAGISEVFRGTGTIDVVGVAGDLESGVDLVVRERPDIVFSDIMLAGRPDGLELPGRLVIACQGPVPVLFFSSYDLPWFQAEALRRGAVGYMLKAVPTESILTAIDQVAAGGTAFTAEMMQDVASAPRSPSPRERQIVGLIARGHGNGEVAALLAISAKTVESHLARLFSRYRVSSRTELVMLAVEQGWLRTARDC